MKHTVESVAFISELVPIGPESLKKKSRDKISLYMKAINYGIILAEKEKEGLEFDMFFCLLFFFPQQCPTSSLVVLAQLFVKPHGEPDWKTNQSLL